jgi:kynurenine formamidase
VGTHIDAPRHMNRDGRTVDRIPLHRLIGPGVRIDVSARIAHLKDRDACVSIVDLADWERRQGSIPQGAIVLLRTGHSRHWGNRRFYLGTDDSGDSEGHALHFPGLEPQAARWLTEERGIRAVGIDTAGIDPGNSTEFSTHRILFERDVPALENLANLERLPDREFVVVALPIKIRGGSGGPLRIVAILAGGSATPPGDPNATSRPFAFE